MASREIELPASIVQKQTVSYPFGYLVESIQSFLMRYWHHVLGFDNVIVTGSMAMMA
jgi:hypothetical protein